MLFINKVYDIIWQNIKINIYLPHDSLIVLKNKYLFINDLAIVNME